MREEEEEKKHTNESSSNSSESIKCNGNQRLLLIPSVVNLMHANNFTLRMNNDDVSFVPNSFAASAHTFRSNKNAFRLLPKTKGTTITTQVHTLIYDRAHRSSALCSIDDSCWMHRSIDELENEIYFWLRCSGPPHVPCIPLRHKSYGRNGLLNSQNAICSSEKSNDFKVHKHFNSPM